jgi:hypothetical protein
MGVAASPFQNIDRGSKYWSKGFKSQAVEANVPTLFKGFIRGARTFREDGLLDSQGDNILPNITPGERAVIFMGGTTKRQSNESNIKQYIFEKVNESKDRSNIEFKLAQAAKGPQGESSIEFLTMLEEASQEGLEINWTTYKRHMKSREEREMIQVPKKLREEVYNLRKTFEFPIAD